MAVDECNDCKYSLLMDDISVEDKEDFKALPLILSVATPVTCLFMAVVSVYIARGATRIGREF